ncbi:MAG: DUF3592 domain-containing protein [Acidimicrobiales bacterium]
MSPSDPLLRPVVAYHPAQAAVVVVFGLLVAWAGGVELWRYLRSRRRLQRTSGIIVGLVEVGGMFRAGSKMFAARIRFTTHDGRVVETTSAAKSYPAPRVGRQVPVVYDPADPAATAERAGVRKPSSAWRHCWSPVVRPSPPGG